MQEWRLGAYQLVRQLGEGGMAQVYLARDVRLGREVAVKVLDSKLAERTGFRERFHREARVIAALDHPNIVPLYDFGESDSLYLVMPYVAGGSLQDMLRRTPLDAAQVATYGAQIADALDYAHQRNVVHRDVKPANMLVHADGRVMLSDFGLAKILDGSPRPAMPRGRPDAGTPEYMAPEQIEGRTDHRSDIYGLGVVLYLLLTGHLPFRGESTKEVMDGHLYRIPELPRKLNPRIPRAIESVVLRALSKHPDERYQRASDLGAALLEAMVAGATETTAFPASHSVPYSVPSASHAAYPASGEQAHQGAARLTGVPALGLVGATPPHQSFGTEILPSLDAPIAGGPGSRGPLSLDVAETHASRHPSAHVSAYVSAHASEAASPSRDASGGGNGMASAPFDLAELIQGMSRQSSVDHPMPPDFPQVEPDVLGERVVPLSVVTPSKVRLTSGPMPHLDDPEPASGQRLWLLLTALLVVMLVAAIILLRWLQAGAAGLAH